MSRTEGEIQEALDEPAVGEVVEVVEEEKLPPTYLKAGKLFLSICLFGALCIALISSVWTASPIALAVLGYLPIIVTIVFLLVIVEHDFKHGIYWAVPFASMLLFLAILGLINPLLDHQLNIWGLAVINLILGLFVVLILTFIEGRMLVPERKEIFIEEFKPENLDAYVHNIEDKCKALNFVIGRVYRSSNGGTAKLRERLRVDKEWYNEFNAIKTEDLKKKKHLAITIMHKIHDRLMLLSKKENELFTEHEEKQLKNIERNPHGEDTVIDVLLANDRDPVQYYYVGALEGAERLIKEIEKL